VIFHHYCLDGSNRTGQETDCEVCRVRLLEAFRAPYVLPPEPAPAPNGCPYCAVSFNPDLAEHIRSVHPDRDVVRGVVHGLPVSIAPEPGPGTVHDTVSMIEPPPEGMVVGDWYVRCSCGFHRWGTYIKHYIAENIVQSWITFHTNHPEERGDR
jgi:hypothetical protein